MAELSCVSFLNCVEYAPNEITGHGAITLSARKAFDLYYKIKNWTATDFSFGQTGSITFQALGPSPVTQSFSYNFNAFPDPNNFDRSTQNGSQIFTEKDLVCNLSMGFIGINNGSFSFNKGNLVYNPSGTIGLAPNQYNPYFYKKGSNYLYLPNISFGASVETNYYFNGGMTLEFFTSWNDATETYDWTTVQINNGAYLNNASITRQAGTITVNGKSLPLYSKISAYNATVDPPVIPANPSLSASCSGTISVTDTWAYNP